MWPLNLYSIGELSGTDGAVLVAYSGWVDAYLALSSAERAVGQFVLTALVASVVLGSIQGYGARGEATVRRSPVISLCIGIPSVLVVAALAGMGYLILGSSIGTFFGILFVVPGVLSVSAGGAIGLAGIGRGVAARLGWDRLWVGVVTGGAFCGIAGISVAATVALLALATTLGTGATLRVLFGTGGVSTPDERAVPPANKI